MEHLMPYLLIIAFAAAVLIFCIGVSRIAFKNVLFKDRPTPNSAENVIGEQAVVAERISNIENKGLVSLRGQIWNAKSADGDDIDKGENVCIISVQGVKLICRKMQTLN